MKRQVSIGEFDIGHGSPQQLRAAQHGHNTVVYEGLDILGRMLAGVADEGLNVVYFEFENDNPNPGSIVQPSIDLTRGRSYYAALENDAATTKRDYLRVSLLSVPSLDTSDPSLFVSNRVTFIATTVGSVAGEGGQPFNVARLSTVYGVALVYAPDPNDRTEDMVFARSYDMTPKQLGANEQISIVWRHTIPEEVSSSSSS
jgi:hypothetical protein